MTLAPFNRIVVGYVPTEQGADARALGVDLAALCGADLLLVSVVRGLWIEHAAEQVGPPLVHSGGRDRAAAALQEAEWRPGVRAVPLSPVLERPRLVRRL